MIWLTLSKARAIISAMAWVELDFIVNLNRTCWTPNSHPDKIIGTINGDLLSLDCLHGHGMQ